METKSLDKIMICHSYNIKDIKFFKAISNQRTKFKDISLLEGFH